MNRKVILALVRKDVHGLLPLIAISIAVFVAQPIVANMNFESEAEFWLMLQRAFYWFGYALAVLLMAGAVQLDPARSLTHDWLTRPISRSEWLSAKLLFMALTISVPIVLARILADSIFYGLPDALRYAVAIDNPAALLAVPILFAIALLTPDLKRSVLVLGVIGASFLIPAWDGSRRFLSGIGIDLNVSFAGMNWLQALPLLAMGMGMALLVFYLLYCRRRILPAWFAFGFGFILCFLGIFPPSSVFGWDQAIAIHEALINEPDDSLDRSLVVEHGMACFAAAPMEANSASNPLVVQATWNEPVAAKAFAEPGSLTIATNVSSRDTLVEWFSASNAIREVRSEWRVDPIRVRGRLVSGSNPQGVELHRSRIFQGRSFDLGTGRTDYWLIPGHIARAYADDPSTRLVLDYDLALLSPNAYELRTDGERYELPELGQCRATVSQATNSIGIECLKAGDRPAIVAAELVGIPASRVDSRNTPTYAPSWLQALGRSRYELRLGSPRLVDSSVVLMTAYRVERILHKRLETEGILGAAPATCPLPNGDTDAVMAVSSWSDDSPHEASSITVEPGVRVEVLDWRSGEAGGNDGTERPVLFLLPGLGATAHSYDVLAPRLAQRFDVIGMTRRGSGASSQPDYGYDIARLSQDVLRVLDTLGVESAVLVGHSIGGEELSYLGAHHPERFAGLVYLDAAYDRTVGQRSLTTPDELLPERPPPRPDELLSYEALQRYSLRTMGSLRTIPEGEIMATYDLNAGMIRQKVNWSIMAAVEMGLVAPDYARIPLPALGIFAVPSSPESLIEPWQDRADPVVLAAVERQFGPRRAFQDEQIARFRKGIADSEVLAIEDGDHWIFVSHEDEVVDAINRFVDRL